MYGKILDFFENIFSKKSKIFIKSMSDIRILGTFGFFKYTNAWKVQKSIFFGY